MEGLSSAFPLILNLTIFLDLVLIILEVNADNAFDVKPIMLVTCDANNALFLILTML